MVSERTDIGGGIVLTKVRPEDAAELFALVDRNREYLRAWMPWVDATKRVADILAFIERSGAQDAEGRGFQCCIRLDGRIVGVIGHVGIRAGDRKTELGYWVSEDHQGRGIVTRAVRALVEDAFSRLGLNRVEIQAGEENLRSRAVAERLGFRLEGILRETRWVGDRYVSHAVYSLLRSDPLPPASV
jgi:ribosomal-protein-serine acetyltransferase